MTQTIAIDTDSLKISYQAGTSGLVVVTFTGVGHGLGHIQTEEFRRTMHSDGDAESNAVIWVIDKRRRWFNGGIAAEIVAAVNDIIESLGQVDRVITLGNSMGGFGAIAFAARF